MANIEINKQLPETTTSPLSETEKNYFLMFNSYLTFLKTIEAFGVNEGEFIRSANQLIAKYSQDTYGSKPPEKTQLYDHLLETTKHLCDSKPNTASPSASAQTPEVPPSSPVLS